MYLFGEDVKTSIMSLESGFCVVAQAPGVYVGYKQLHYFKNVRETA